MKMLVKEMGQNDLRLYTNKIIECDNGIKKNMNKIAILLAEVNQKKLFELENFKSTAEYGNAVFGYSKGNVSKMVRVAERFLIGKNEWTEYNTSQLAELLPLSDEQIATLDVNADMTVKDIRENVSNLKKLESKDTESKDTESETEENETVTTESGAEVVSTPKQSASADDILKTVYSFLVDSDMTNLEVAEYIASTYDLLK